MESLCGICSKPSQQLFEAKQGIYACLKCNPMMPEIELGSNKGGDEELYCQICSKRFTKMIQYQNHMRNHKSEKRFNCTYCNKAFSQSNNLRAHLRTHTNERPFKCNQCGKAFTQVTNLNNHIRLHTGERPYVCPVEGCGKAYAQVTNLNQHRKRHLSGNYVDGASAVDCNICGMTFEHRIRMYIHRKEVHNTQSEIFPCSNCDRTFQNEEEFTQHQLEHTSSSASDEKSKFYWCVFKACNLQCVDIESYRRHLADEHNLHIKANTISSIMDKEEDPALRPRGRPPKARDSDFQSVYLPAKPKVQLTF